MYRQLVTPTADVSAAAGSCLAFVQDVYAAPKRYKSAWIAWENTAKKHIEPLPEASVPVWFSHYGTYGKPPTYENWGHVVAYFPGTGFLSSPGTGYGSEWLPTIQAVEQRFNSNYVGWSEDLNGLQIVEYVNTPTPEDDDMANSQYFVATSDSPSGIVKANDVWVRPAPGEGLHFLTAGQAHDWFAMNGLDFNSPNVFGKEGSWYDLAFQEDIEAAKRTAEAQGK